MKAGLSDSQERAIIAMSNKQGANVSSRTMQSLERMKLVHLCEQGWRITAAGSAVAAAIREYKPTGALAGIIQKREQLATMESHEIYPHDLRYVAEKLLEMFGPALAANPDARTEFLRVLSEDVSTRLTGQ